MTAFSQRAEIKKPEIYRLLHFENKWWCDKNPRDVGLQRAHFPRPVWIRFRGFEKSNQLLLRTRGGVVLALRRVPATADRLWSRPTIRFRSGRLCQLDVGC